MSRRSRDPAPPPTLMKTNVLVSVGTGLSRLTGFARIVALAAVLGRDDLADSFIVGNNLPNQVYELLLGGILTASLVPQFVEYFERDDEDSISALVSSAIWVLFALTFVATCAATLISLVWADPRISDQVTRFAYFFLPQIFFYGLSALMSALLNARRRFLAAAYTPVLNNIVAIAALLGAGALYELEPSFTNGTPPLKAVAFLGLGTTLGVVAMTVGLMPATAALRLRLRWRPDVRHPAVHQLVRLSGWAVGYVVANQVASSLVQRLAQRETGGVSAYNYAYTFFVLPHGLLAMSLVTTFAPDLASSALNRRWGRFVSRVSLGVRALAFVVAPAAAMMAVMSRPLMGLLVRGNFTPDDAEVAARALTAFSLGLVGFSIYIFVLRGFYARKDTRTPCLLNIFENALNIIGALIAVNRWGVEGLAGSFAVAYLISAVVALVVLHRQVVPLPLSDLAWWTLKVGAGAGWCALAAAIAGSAVGSDVGWGALARLAAGGIAGSVAFVAVMALQAAVARHQPRPRTRKVRPRPQVEGAHR